MAADPATTAVALRRTRWAGVSRVLGTRRSMLVGGGLLGLVAALCVLVPIFSRYGPNEFVGAPLQAPSWSHPFGTDTYGRDVFVRVWAGGRIDLVIGLFGVSVPLLLGSVIGTSVAIAGRWPEAVLMRLVDAIVAFPGVILILTLVVVIGPDRTLGPLPAGVPALFAAFFAAGWALYARLARGETLALRGRDFVTATHLLGYSNFRIVTRHILPTVIRTTATYAVSDAILVIITAASLAFLGAGVQPPTAEWGAIMYEGRSVLATAWWVSTMPGVVVAVTGVGISLLADGIIARSSERHR